MLDTYLEQLPMCASPKEVLQLMSGREFPSSDMSAFEDDILFVRKNTKRFGYVAPPEGLIGLTFRTMFYLKLEGVFGKIITGGGPYVIGGALERVIRELSKYGEINVPTDITGDMIDKHIEALKKKGTGVIHIHRELSHLEQWIQNSHRIPYFLRLNPTLFEDSQKWSKLVKDKDKLKQDYFKDLGGSKEPYPLDQLTTIVGEAIKYIETYGDDCLKAVRLYKKIVGLAISDAGARNRLTKELLLTKHRYIEPHVKLVQEHILSTGKTYWRTDPKHKNYAPKKAIIDAVRKLQASCVIVILMLTAMRKAELDTLERFPSIEKTGHHELDCSMNLTRLIHKTALGKNGDQLKMPVPPIVIRAVDLLSKLSKINDGKSIGYINLSSFSNENEYHGDERVGNLIYSFCDDLEIDAPTPHQFRHAMAFIVAYLNDAHGIELAMTLLGHKSIEMTKKYLGHYKKLVQNSFDVMYAENEVMQEVYKELKETLDKEALEKIIAQIEQESPMVGPIVKRISQFSGSLTKEAKVFFSKSLRLVVERGMFAVTQFPTHFCIKDLTDSAQMACQIGLNREDYRGAPIVPSQCEPKCGCRLYTGENIGVLKELTDEVEEAYPDELRDRLSQNTYFDAASFGNPFTQYIEEYDEIMEKRSS